MLAPQREPGSREATGRGGGVRPRDGSSRARTTRERPRPQFTRSSPTRVAGQGWGGLPGGRAGWKGRPRPRPQFKGRERGGAPPPTPAVPEGGWGGKGNGHRSRWYQRAGGAARAARGGSAPWRRSMADTLTIIDNRTGKRYELPIRYGTYPTYGANIPGADLRQIKASDDDFGLLSYDPAFMNTASCKSAITFIDGERGILRYRGYPIEQLAERSSYLESAYLVLHGELPTETELRDWTREVAHHTLIHESIKKFMDGFHYDAHPMGILVS